MPEIFKFTQLRAPSGINVEEVRQKHIPFFKGIEEIESSVISAAFKENGFVKGNEQIDKHMMSNEFKSRTFIPNMLYSGNWKGDVKEHEVFFELSQLLSKFSSDNSKESEESVFLQVYDLLGELAALKRKDYYSEIELYFEDLLALYLNSKNYPSYLRLLIGLRRWHFVFSRFSLSKIKTAFKHIPVEPLISGSPMYFLFEAKILLPKYLFEKNRSSKARRKKQL